MFSTTIQPRFGDTNYRGHINNATLALWFETARNPFLRIFVPDLNVKMETFPLIMAHTDYDFMEPLFIKYEVEIRSWITHIGSKSFTVYHEAWQKKRLCVHGSAVIVHYDFNIKQSIPLPDDKKKSLKTHMPSAPKPPRPSKKQGVGNKE